MPINPRYIIPYLPAIALVFLLIIWGGLASWSGDAQDKSDVLRRQLQTVRISKPVLQAIQANRKARPVVNDPQNQRGLVYAIVEDTLRTNGLSNTVRQLRPEVREQETHVEEQLGLSLTQLDRAQLARFLYETQKALPEMTVESLSLRKNNNGFLDIDAVFLVKKPKF